MSEAKKPEMNEYIIVERTDAPLLVFCTPTDEVSRDLASVLSTLLISDLTESPSASHRKENIHSEGNLDEVLDTLMYVLRRDYAENKVDWDGEFEYRVYQSNHWPGSIEILTRLFSAEKPGSVLYGRVIRRASTSQYLMWVDD